MFGLTYLRSFKEHLYGCVYIKLLVLMQLFISAGEGLGVGISFMLDGTLRLMSSDTKIFRVRQDLGER
jgi:hypothetical protein